MSSYFDHNSTTPRNSAAWPAMNAVGPHPSWATHPRHARPWRGRFGHSAGYWIVATAFLMNMAMSAVPTPLYVLYQQRDHLSSLMITVIFAVYAGGVITSLFLAGHVSDWLGRRRVMVIGLLVNALSALVFIVAPSLAGLIVARVISGISVGLVTATATAYLAELHARAHPDANGRRAQVIAIFVNLGGIGLGPLIAGLLAQFAPAPLVLPYLITGLVLVALATFVLASPETVTPPSEHVQWHPQHVAVPAAARGRYFAGAIAGLTAFSVFGVFSSLVPHFLAGSLGSSSHLLAGAVAFCAFAAGALAQVALSPLRTSAMLRTSVPVLIAGLAMLVTGIWFATLVVFIIGGIATGAGAGLVFRGAMVRAGEGAATSSRAEVMAGFFLASYIGLSLPVIALGVILNYVAARGAILAFATVAALAIVVSVKSIVTDPVDDTVHDREAIDVRR
ncbi:MAG TPA: MFS transporter [Acidimicrobiales bacterium]